MNIVKKLKLALLATSIMLFPKAGHTMMKPEDEMLSVGSSRQLRAGGNDSLDLMSIEQLNIAKSSSSPFSTATAITPSIINVLQIERLFGRYFIPSEKTINNLDSLLRTNPSGAQEITNAIRDKLLNRFASSRYRDLDFISNPANPQRPISIAPDAAGVKPFIDDVISFALTLSKEAIEKRSDQLAKMILDLAVVENEPVSLLQTFVIYSPERKLENEVYRNTPSIMSLVKDLLKLDPNQVENRTKEIKNNKEFLLPTKEFVYPIISSLMKLRTMEIGARANSMKKILSFIKNISDKNQFIMAANQLTNDELELGVNNMVSILSSSTELQPMASVLRLLRLNFERSPSSSRGSSITSLVLRPELESARGPSSSSRPDLEEAAPQPSSSSSIHSAPTTFRTAGANPSAKIKHSAVAIQLPNQDLLGDAYELVVNHRTRGEGPMVRIYDPKTKVYDNLGTLPVSSGFRDTTFNITDWAKAARDTSSLGTQVATYLSFMDGKSDVHSFKIQSRGKVLKEIVFGDAASESQAGVHVYGPETDRDANEWSAKQSDDKEE